MKLLDNKKWQFNFQLSPQAIHQTILVFIISLVLVIFLKPKPNTFHLVDGLIFLQFFYILYLKRLKIQLIYQNKLLVVDFILILSAIFWVMLFSGLRRIDLGFSLLITPEMWFETILYSIILITIGIVTAVKIGFISFIGWKIELKKGLILAVLIFFMALIEEIFFRGLVFKYLQQIIPDPILIPFMLSILIFGLAHFKNYGISMVTLATLAGIFYCLTYLRTGNIFCATLVHTVTNICWQVFFKTNNRS